MNDIAVTIKDISKRYKIYNKPFDKLKEAIWWTILRKRRQYYREFWALKDVNLSISKGTTIGIIGQNGSGKSTLLQIICGVLQPTSGIVQVTGRISSLLELGMGFHPEFTGRENVYMHGAVMGFNRNEIDQRIHEIEAFAEIGEFIDQPVKIYSSGMFVRLAFASAINVNPDILIIDEALAVGDMYFKEKCIDKMKQFRKEGKTIIFVSHSLSAIRNFCDMAAWIDQGKLLEINEASYLCEKYQDYMKRLTHDRLDGEKFEVKRSNAESVEIDHIKMNCEHTKTGQDLIFEIEYKINRNISGISIGFSILNEEGELVTLYNTTRDEFKGVPITIGSHTIRLIVPQNDFLNGKYYASVYIGDDIPMITYSKIEYGLSYSVQTPKNKNGLPIAEGMFNSKHSWEVVDQNKRMNLLTKTEMNGFTIDYKEL